MTEFPRIKMIDVGDKKVTVREAAARGRVVMKDTTFNMVREGNLPKGDALAVAKVAGIMAAKETHRLIPMCHPLLIDNISLEFTLDKKAPAVEITATVKGSGKTGFEMEALTAVTIAALTIYDMCKAVDTSMKLVDIRLIKKSGGKSGTVVLE